MSTKYTITFALDQDVDDIAELEALCFPVALSSEDIAAKINRTKDLSIVCRLKGLLVGFLLVKRSRRMLKLLDAATLPAYRRKGIQRAMLRWLLKRAKDHVGKVSAIVDERNLDACKWLSALGFKALNTIPELFNEGDITDDGIYFEMNLTNADQ